MTMTITMSIWWPKSGVWIYQIVTGVTSVVGVLSTHLVLKVKIFKLIMQNGSLGTRREIALSWMPQSLNDEKSRLIQIMAWCRQAASHYLKQCWPRSMSPYAVIRPRWVLTIEEGSLQNINSVHSLKRQRTISLRNFRRWLHWKLSNKSLTY